jgi:L-ribulose-5-phosphate 3-epimerase
VKRRRFIRKTTIALTAGSLASRLFWLNKVAGEPCSDQRYKIAVCDWMILKRQKLGAFQLTKDIGADGVELDIGGLGDRDTFDNKLTDPIVRESFVNKAERARC